MQNLRWILPREILTKIKIWSGRTDLNRRPHGPEPCALAGLSHAPNAWDYNLAIRLWQVVGEVT